MTEVAVCPRCAGDRRVYNARSGESEDCPTCSGRGVVRVPPLDEAHEAPASDPRDLTYRQ